MAVNVKMGVDIGAFKSGIKEGQNILKGLNAEMKAADAEFKATGNSEKYMSDKTKTLNSQLNVQKGIVDQAQKALQKMTDAGVDPADKAYQQLYATMMQAQAGMYETQAALNGIGTSSQEAAAGADNLANSVNSIGKKISLEQVIGGIDKITSGLENAAKKAISLGEQLWDSIMDAAKWADDTQTMAQMYGIDLDTFQRMQKLVTNGLDTTVEAMLKSQSKLKKGIGSDSKEVAEAFKEIGVSMTENIGQGKYGPIEQAKDSLELFWEAGRKIMELGDENKQEDIAQKLFGRSWHELVPLFESYDSVEEYNKALEDVNVNSEDTVNNLATLNDTVGELEGNLQTLTTEVLGALAPGLTELAGSLNNVLTSIIEYMQTPEGKEMLKGLSDSISQLFGDLSQIDPASVVESFTTVFNGLVDGLKWIAEKSSTVIDALKAIVAGWAALKLTGGALDILRLIDGIKGLGGGGGTEATGTAAASGGKSWIAKAAGHIKNAMPAVMETGAFVAPFALFIDGMIHDQQMVAEMTAKGEQSMAEYQDNIEKYAESGMFDIWDVLTKYTTINGTQQDNAKMKTFAERFSKWWYEDAEDASLDALADAMSDDDFFAFKDAMDDILSGKQLYSSEEQQQFVDALNTAIEAAEGLMDPVNVDMQPKDGAAQNLANKVGQVTVPGVELQPQADAAQDLAKQVGVVEVQAKLVFGSMKMNKYANGINYVPYDGMLAELHKGERVVPAREMASRNYSSNLYVESMYMSGGADAEGLAAAMAAAQKRTMSGYGS